MSAPIDPDAPHPPTRLRIAAAASLAAAGALVVALVSPTMWVGMYGDSGFEVGLVRMAMCVEQGCHQGELSQLGQASATWGRMGAAAFVLAGLAALAHAITAVLALAGGRSRWYRPGVAAALALVTFSFGVAYVLAAPDLGLDPGLAFFTLFGGAAVGAAGGVVLHPHKKVAKRPGR